MAFWVTPIGEIEDMEKCAVSSVKSKSHPALKEQWVRDNVVKNSKIFRLLFSLPHSLCSFHISCPPIHISLFPFPVSPSQFHILVTNESLMRREGMKESTNSMTVQYRFNDTQYRYSRRPTVFTRLSNVPDYTPSSNKHRFWKKKSEWAPPPPNKRRGPDIIKINTHVR